MHKTHNKTYHKHTYIPQVEGVDRKPADKIEENYQTEFNTLQSPELSPYNKVSIFTNFSMKSG